MREDLLDDLGSSIVDRTRIRFPQRGEASTSTSEARRIRSAHHQWRPSRTRCGSGRGRAGVSSKSRSVHGMYSTVRPFGMAATLWMRMTAP
jgi:hypothetical protein